MRYKVKVRDQLYSLPKNIFIFPFFLVCEATKESKIEKKIIIMLFKKKKLLGPDKIEKVMKVYGQKCNL